MSMLFLFQDEIQRYQFLEKEIIDKMDSRIPVEKTDLIYYLAYNKKCLELDAECQQITQDEYIQHRANTYDLRYLCKEVVRKEVDEDIRFKFELYSVQKDYTDMLYEKEVFIKRIDKAYDYILEKFPKIDIRNLYVHGIDGCLYLGERLKNEDEPRMLGALAPGTILMNEQQYSNLIQSIKDEVEQ